MDNTFIPKAIDTVKDAIEADNSQEYETALALYKKALEYFVTGLKYETNPTAKNTIMKRVDGYMKRAETLKEIVEERSAAKNGMGGGGGGGGAATASAAAKKDANTPGNDEEKKKLRGGLEGAIVQEKPNVKWSDVAGLELAKETLREAVILPVKFPQLFTGKRRPWKGALTNLTESEGILLYGPPGTGKSYLAKAVATESDAVFFAVSSSDLVSKWQGESEKLVRNLFEMAREHPKSIVFIDEVDSLCGSRSEGENDSARRIKTEFLVQMQGVGNTHDGVLVLAATNVPWELDPAMRRRFEKRVYIPLPEEGARSVMFKLHLGDTANTLDSEHFDELGKISKGYSGSDISVVTREALMEPLRKCQTGKQFAPVPGEGSLMLTPAAKYPSCPWCTEDLSFRPAPRGEAKPCPRCGAIRVSLYDVPTEKLKVPDVTYDDFVTALQKAHKSVALEELTRFEEWTKEFGQEG